MMDLFHVNQMANTSITQGYTLTLHNQREKDMLYLEKAVFTVFSLVPVFSVI